MGKLAKGEGAKHLMLAPPLLFFAAFSIFPLLFTLYVSLSNWNISGQHNFVGVENYRRILSDVLFMTSLRNTVLFTLFMTTIEYVLGFGVALLVRGVNRNQPPLRLVILLPMMLTPVVVGFVWKMMLDPSYGPVNDLLGRIGVPSIEWLSNPRAAFAGIVLTDVWEWTPFTFLILFAGLRSLPTEPFESAKVDGASAWRIFWDLTFPMMIPATIAAVLLRAIEAFKLFDIVFLITGGGPGIATSTVTLSSYFTGLRSGDLGTAAAMSIVLLVIVLVIAIVMLQAVTRVMSRRPRYQRSVARTAAA